MAAKEERISTIKILHVIISSIFIATLLLSLSRYIFEPKNRDRCNDMLNKGQWVSNDFKEWEPSGCLPVNYKTQEMGTCLTNQRVIYIGDSIMREQYFAMLSLMGRSSPKKHAEHDDQHFFIKSHNVTLDLWWDPYINTTRTLDLFNGNIEKKPTLLIVGSGPWYMKNLGNHYYSPWKQAIDRVFEGATHHAIADTLLVSPIEIVEEAKLTPLRRSTITHEKAEIMNSYLRERERVETKTPLAIPFVWNDIVTTSINQTDDGLHFKLPVTVQQAQIALNYRCNNDPSMKTVSYPYTTTCCYTYPTPAWYQQSIILFILVIVPLGIFIYYLPPHCLVQLVQSFFPSSLERLISLLIFGLGLMYMYIGDRTQFFGKMTNHINDPFTFTFLCLGTLMIGLFTLQDTQKGFLNSDQANEWKGWLQLMILMSRLTTTTASTSISYSRVFFTAYLFQTGYDHFSYLFRHQDFSASRFLNVTMRINLLPCVLCYLMNTDYFFYDLSALLTFWFCVVWITMRIVPSETTWVVVVKIAVMAAVTTALIHVQGVLETCLYVLSSLFKVQWDALDVRSRLATDAWIVYGGMVCALVVLKCREYKVTPDRWVHMVGCALAICGLVSYFILLPYVSWIPLMSFIVLRNCTSWTRSRYSRFFAWIGTFSLEIYIGQYHMWLAADTKAWLVVLPHTTWVHSSILGWYVNISLSTVLFFYVCYHINQATSTLTTSICTRKTKEEETNDDDDVVPLLPISKEEEEQEEEVVVTKRTWYLSIFNNDWIRAFLCLLFLGILNRFC